MKWILFLTVMASVAHAKEGTNLYLDCIQDGEFTSMEFEIEEKSQKENMNHPITFKATLYPDGTAKLWQSFEVLTDLEGTHSDTEIEFSGTKKYVFGDGNIVSNVSFNRINGEYIKTIEYTRKGAKHTRYLYGNCRASNKTKF